MRLAGYLPSPFSSISAVLPVLAPLVVIVVLLLLLAVPPAVEAETNFHQVIMSALPSTWSLDQLAREFRTMRARSTRFDGTDATSSDVDSQDKEKHDVMETLRSTIGRMGGSPGPEIEVVVATLGPPDFVSTDPEVTRGNLTQADTLAFMPGPYIPDGGGGGGGDGEAADGGQYYIGYKWRGLHDYMWFRASGGHIQESGWYYSPA